MQEFESISASSYDPSALAAKLTAKSAEGWTVVAIVPTGGDVTAFLSRGSSDTSGDDDKATRSTAAAEAAEPQAAEAATVAAQPEAEAVSEPSGWAIAPEPVSQEPTTVQSTPTYEPTPSYQPTSTYEPTPSYQPTPAPEPTPTPTVPAGWYADPAGRFELRYWDGNAWTEHVSRAGQQFTDPPVA